ncbi:MAG TPA: hypothetical protein VK208_08415 [Pyrinomonadaceae bacterium]|jgi:hypothetical protein|nr:hypothetical protein [Pyrinomonadaceae bacterium]
MPNQTAAQIRSLGRLPTILVLISVSIFSQACGLFGTHKKVQVPQLLTPLSEANTAQLITEVNRLAAVRSIHGKIDIVFEDTSFAEAGIAEKYRQADGQITVQRPGKIYLIIQVPFIAKDIAQMTSNGESFRVAVLQGDDKYRRFVKGTNSATYEKLDLDGQSAGTEKPKKTMNAKEAVNALSNLRPQHLTDALMLSSIPDTSQNGRTYARSEFYQEEPDTRPQAKSGVRVVRGYYLLEEFSQGSSGEAQLLRRFWFDRVGGIRLARIQSFNEQGLLITDVAYWDEKPFGETLQLRLPSRVEITRPHDHYKLSISYQSAADTEIDREFQPDAFVLENRWQLPEVDLDARQRNKAAVTP